MRLTYLENRRNVFNTLWTAELVWRLKELWAEGYSATAIADELKGMTRCSVLGKVHRLKLPARKARQQPDKPYIRKRRRANGVPKPPTPPPRPPRPPPPPPPLAPRMRQLTFAKLRPRQCKWPLGGLLEPPRLFCAADTQGEVYCEFHQRIARSGK